MVANATRAWQSLTDVPLPTQGRFTRAASPQDAATGVQFVQESAPEKPELKRSLLSQASEAAPADVVFGSSTSGILPTTLQADMTHPQRLVVGHPFNPVYLLPLVEVCPGQQTTPDAVQRAADVYASLGMKPLVLQHEIDGFVADRLLEALWREALWLVNDGVATVEQVDDAIRYGAGLRWASMGTMLTYRIAGGEGGMRHFMEQFGPALQWPWSKLTDVPELTDELLDRIEEQSDAQAAGAGVRELERLRDDCLVGVLQGLARARLRRRSSAQAVRAEPSFASARGGRLVMICLHARQHREAVARKRADLAGVGVDVQIERVATCHRGVTDQQGAVYAQPLRVVGRHPRLSRDGVGCVHLVQELDGDFDGVHRRPGALAILSAQPEGIQEQLVRVGEHLSVRRIVHVAVVVDRRRGNPTRELV